MHFCDPKCFPLNYLQQKYRRSLFNRLSFYIDNPTQKRKTCFWFSIIFSTSTQLILSCILFSFKFQILILLLRFCLYFLTFYHFIRHFTNPCVLFCYSLLAGLTFDCFSAHKLYVQCFSAV